MRFSSCTTIVVETVMLIQYCLLQVHGCHNFFIGLDLVFSRTPLVSYHYQASSHVKISAWAVTSPCSPATPHFAKMGHQPQWHMHADNGAGGVQLHMLVGMWRQGSSAA